MCGPLVQQSEHPANAIVPQSREPSGLIWRKRFQMPSDNFHEHQLAQPQPNAFAARTLALCLRKSDFDQLVQQVPGCARVAPNQQQPWQCVYQWIERMRVASEKTANELCSIGSAATFLDSKRQFARHHISKEIQRFSFIEFWCLTWRT